MNRAEVKACRSAVEHVRLYYESRNMVGMFSIGPDPGAVERIRGAIRANPTWAVVAGLRVRIDGEARYLKLARRSIRNCDQRPWVWGDSTAKVRARFQAEAARHARAMIWLARLVRKVRCEGPPAEIFRDLGAVGWWANFLLLSLDVSPRGILR